MRAATIVAWIIIVYIVDGDYSYRASVNQLTQVQLSLVPRLLQTNKNDAIRKKTRKGKRREKGRSGKSLVNGLDPTRAPRNVLGGAVITAINTHTAGFILAGWS